MSRHLLVSLGIPVTLLALCAAPSPAAAADCTASDGTELSACFAQLAAGDTLTMNAGSFEISAHTFSDLHGTDTAPIVIQGTLGSAGERQSHIIGQSTGSNTLEIQQSSYLAFRDFELSHAAGATGNSVDLVKFAGSGTSHHITFENLDVHDCGNVAISSQADEIHDIVVADSHVHDIGGSCFYWGYYEADYERKVHHSQIVHNLLQRCPQSASSDTHYGIQLKSGNHDNLVEDNVLVDVGGTTRVGIAVYHNAPKPVGGPLAGSNVIRGNLIVRSRNEGINASAGAIIENNIVIDAVGIGIFLQPRTYQETYYGSLQVRNNTVFQSGSAHAIRFDSSAWSHDDPSRPTEFVGNLAIVSSGDGLRPPSGAATVDKNATNGGDNGAAGTITLSAASQAVVSTTFGEADYLYPVAGGPLVDVGVDPAAAIDFNHTNRDGTPDVGAYEWTAASNPGWTLDEDELKPEDPGGYGGNGGAGQGGTSATGGGSAAGGTGQGGTGSGNDGQGANASTPTEDDGGCDCATGPGTPSRQLPLAALLLSLWWLRRSSRTLARD